MKLNIILLIVLFLLGGITGWLVNDTKDFVTKSYDGLRFKSNMSHVQALNFAKSYDAYGDWVCSNVKGMSYQRCVEVAQHECGHEIWAEICEKNSTLCEEGQELLYKYSGGQK